MKLSIKLSILFCLFTIAWACKKPEEKVTPKPVLVLDDKAKFPNEQRGLTFVTTEVYNAIPIVTTPSVNLRKDATKAESTPTSIDLSINMPPVGNQGAQGSCVAWATTYGLRSYLENYVNKIPYLNGTALNNEVLFSPAYIYNQINGGNDNGSRIDIALAKLKSEGTTTLADMPYTPTNFTTQPNANQKANASKYKIKDWGRIGISLPSMKAFIANKNPIIIAADVDANMTKLTEKFGTELGWKTFESATNRGGHAMLIVGYDDTKSAFKVQNSWGNNWGNKGYFWMSYDLLFHIREAYVATVEGKLISEPKAQTNITQNETVYFNAGNHLYAVDAITGLEKWKYQIGINSEKTAPIFNDGIVYTIAQDKIFAIDALNGSKKWINEGANSTPIIEKGLLYYLNNTKYGIKAVDPKTGEQKWEFNEKDKGTILEDFTIKDDVIYAGGASCCNYIKNNYFYAINANNGTKKWETSSILPFINKPSISDELVFTSIKKYSYSGGTDLSTTTLLALDKQTGKTKWEFISKGQNSFTTFYDGMVYCSTDDGALFGLDSKTGDKKWEFFTKRDIYFERFNSLPVISKNNVYLLGIENLYAFNAKTGSKIWIYTERYNSFNSYSNIVVANNQIYIGQRKGMYSVDNNTGVATKLWGTPSLSGEYPPEAGGACVVDKSGNIFISGKSETK